MLFYVDSRVPATIPMWQPSTAYTLGDFVRFSWNLEAIFVCRATGTSGASEPGLVDTLDGSYPEITDNTVDWEGCWGSEEFGWETACLLSMLMSVSTSYPLGSPRTAFIPSTGRADFLIAKGQGTAVLSNPYLKYEDISGFESTPLWPGLFTNIAFISVNPVGQFGWEKSGYEELTHTSSPVRGPEMYDSLTYKVANEGRTFAFTKTGINALNTIKLIAPTFLNSKVIFESGSKEGTILQIGNPSLDVTDSDITPGMGLDFVRGQFRGCEIRYSHRFNALIFQADSVVESTDFLPDPEHPRFAIGFNAQFMDGDPGEWETVNIFSLSLENMARNNKVTLTLRDCDFSALTRAEFLFAPARSFPVEIIAEGCIWPDGIDLWESVPGMALGTWKLTALNCRRAGESFLAGKFSEHTDSYDLVKVDGVYRVGGYVDQYDTDTCWHVLTKDYLEPFYDMAELPAMEANVQTPGKYTVTVYFVSDKGDLTQDDVVLTALGPSTTDPGLSGELRNMTSYGTTRKLDPLDTPEVLSLSTEQWSGLPAGHTKYKIAVPVYVSHAGRVRALLSLGCRSSELFICPEPALLNGTPISED